MHGAIGPLGKLFSILAGRKALLLFGWERELRCLLWVYLGLGIPGEGHGFGCRLGWGSQSKAAYIR